MIKVLVINQPLNNRGDEAAHKALIRSLVDSDADLSIRVLFVGSNPDSVRQFMVEDARVSYVNIRHKIMLRFTESAKKSFKHPLIWHLHPVVKEVSSHYAWADAVLSSPGGICMGGFQDWKHLFFLDMARRMHKPVYYYGRSIGPFPVLTEDNRRFKAKSIELLNYFSFISLRESQSIRYAEEMGIRNVVPTTDMAFLDSPDVQALPEELSFISSKPYVVFVPNLLVWHVAYKGKASRDEVVDFWCKALGIIRGHFNGHAIVMLPQLFNVGSEGDFNLFHEIAGQDGGGDIFVVDESYSSDVQQAIIRGASALFGSRYHSVVFAINNDVPFIAFSYEHKIEGLLDTLGLKQLSVDIRHLFDAPKVEDSVLSGFSAKLPGIGHNPEASMKAKRMARDCFDAFISVLSSMNQQDNDRGSSS